MIKCLVWDLDNTLWEGTLVEDIEVNLTKQKKELVLELDKRGILQSIASRNSLDMVKEKLTKFGLWEYFLYPQCNFGSKAKSIKKIANQMNINMNSIGFIDDDDFELHEIKYFFPEVYTYKAKEFEGLLERPEFEVTNITKESAARRKMMISRQEFKEAEEKFSGSREEFLKSCNMTLTVRPATEMDTNRIYELAARTNKINSLGGTINSEMIKEYIEDQNLRIYVAELSDSFGEYGVVGVTFVKIIDDTALIELFCISCRIESRGIGVAFLGKVIDTIQTSFSEVKNITSNYRYSDQNRSALMLLKLLGFTLHKKEWDYNIYILALPYKTKENGVISVNGSNGKTINDKDISDKIKELLGEVMEEDFKEEKNTIIGDDGMLDSLNFLRFITAIEKEFDITILGEDLDLELDDFKSLESVTELVKQRLKNN